MRGIQLENLLTRIDSKLLSNKNPVEKATIILEILNSKRAEVEILINSASKIENVRKYSNTYFADQLELRDEIGWSITILEYFLKLGSFDFSVSPIDQSASNDEHAFRKILAVLISIIDNQ